MVGKKKMIRILQVIAGMNAGGMETMIMNYYRNIDRNKIQFDFLITAKEKCFYEDEINKLGGNIYRITARNINLLKNRKELKEFFKKNKYEIVEFHQGITYYYPLKMAKKYGVKTRIIHNHGIDRVFLKKYKIYNEIFAKRRISGLATNYFSCSEEVNDQLFSNKILKNNNIEIVPNAIDIEKYRYNYTVREKIRKELNIEENTKVYGHIGTFTYPKNHKFLIEIFANISQKEKKSKLILIGNGALKSDIKREVEEKGLQEKVTFLGTRKDIDKLLSAIDCFLFPSIFEGIPLTLIEAQSNGVPVIMSDTISEKVLINSNCKRISLEDKEKWIEESIKIKKENEIDRIKKNENMAQTNFNIRIQAKKLQEIYLKYAEEN